MSIVRRRGWRDASQLSWRKAWRAFSTERHRCWQGEARDFHGEISSRLYRAERGGHPKLITCSETFPTGRQSQWQPLPIIGSTGAEWLNRYEALLTMFADADALLRADEACELFVLASEFLDGYFDRYLARSSFWARRRCTKRVNAALDALQAFAERNPSMVG